MLLSGLCCPTVRYLFDGNGVHRKIDNRPAWPFSIMADGTGGEMPPFASARSPMISAAQPPGGEPGAQQALHGHEANTFFIGEPGLVSVFDFDYDEVINFTLGVFQQQNNAMVHGAAAEGRAATKCVAFHTFFYKKLVESPARRGARPTYTCARRRRAAERGRRQRASGGASPYHPSSFRIDSRPRSQLRLRQRPELDAPQND